MRRIAALGAWAALGGLTACGDVAVPAEAGLAVAFPHDFEGAVSIEDSAGVRIVTSAAPAWGTDHPWTVDSVPALTIGGDESAPDPYLFQFVRSAVRLENGNVAVADIQAGELRWFAASGRHLRTHGQGSGPGEFQGIRWATWVPGDTVVAWDWGLSRISVFGPDGAFVRSYPVERSFETPRAEPMGAVRAHRIVVERQYREEVPDGYHRDSVSLAVVDLETNATMPVGTFPGTEGFTVMLAENSSQSFLVPFQRRTVVDVAGGRIAVGVTDRHEVMIFDGAGELAQRVRRAVPLTPVGQAAREAFHERQREARAADTLPPDPALPEPFRDPARLAAQRRAADRFAAEVELPPFMPAYNAVVLARDGSLWIQEFRAPGERRSGTYTVFAADGRWLGEVALARAPLDLGADFVLAGDRSAAGTPVVQLFPLRR